MALNFRHSSFIQYLLSAYYEPGIVQGIVHTKMNKKDKNPLFAWTLNSSGRSLIGHLSGDLSTEQMDTCICSQGA